MNKKLIILSLIVLLAFGIIFLAKNSKITNNTHALEGRVAPDFTLPDINGKPFHFASVKGKVVILDFWATWCPPCRAEIPHFNELSDQYKKQGLEVIGISLDQGGPQAVKNFTKTTRIDYPILMGNSDITNKYGGVRGIPTTFIIDRKGKIVEKFVGYRDKETFEVVIQKLL